MLEYSACQRRPILIDRYDRVNYSSAFRLFSLGFVSFKRPNYLTEPRQLQLDMPDKYTQIIFRCQRNQRGFRNPVQKSHGPYGIT